MPVNYLEQPSGSGGGRAYISIPSTTIAAADWEIEFKFRVPVGTTGDVNLMGEGSGSNNRFYVNFTTGVISMRMSGTAYNSAASGITAGSTHIVRFSRVGTQTRFHLNGVQVSFLPYVVNVPVAMTLLCGQGTTSNRVDFYYAKVTSASVNRDWNANGITSGTVLPDIVSAQDATLINFTGTPWKIEPTILSLTTPMVPGSAFSGTCEGIPDGAGTLSHGGISIAVTVTSDAFSGTVPMFSDGILYPFLPVTGAVWTLTVGANVATYGSTLAIPAGWDVTRDELFAVSNFAGLIEDTDTLQSAFVAASNALTTSDRGLYPTDNGLVVFRTSRVEVDTVPFTFTMFVQRASGYVYEHTFTLDAEGAVGIAPVMPADAPVTVDAGVTVLGTYAATAGSLPITYSLSGTDAADFAVNSSTAAVTFVSPAVGSDTLSVTVVATNAYGSDNQVLSVTVNPEAPPSEYIPNTFLGFGIGFGI